MSRSADKHTLFEVLLNAVLVEREECARVAVMAVKQVERDKVTCKTIVRHRKQAFRDACDLAACLGKQIANLIRARGPVNGRKT